MPYHPMRTTYSFGTGLTPAGKKLLIFYAAVYVSELVLEHWLHIPLVPLLQLHPVFHHGFQPWQILTAHFIHDPAAPIGFLLNHERQPGR